MTMLRKTQILELSLKNFKVGGLPGGSRVKSPPEIQETRGSILDLGRSPEVDMGNSYSWTLWYSYLEKPMDRRSLAGYSPGMQRVGQD